MIRSLRRRRDRGSMALEFVVLVPVLFGLVAVVVAGARVWWAQTAVTQLAASAARQASISRNAAEAVSSAEQIVRWDAQGAGLTCGAGSLPSVSVDAGGFGRQPGEPASVSAQVTCVVPLSDLFLPGIPGSITVDYTATSPLDRFRARG